MSDLPPEEHEKTWKKIQQKEHQYVKEQELLRRISDDYETLEEVWDRKTLLTLYKIIQRGIIDRVHGTLASGKEARVYAAEDPEGVALAIKVYLVSTAGFKKGRMKYLIGDPRFQRVRRKTRDIIHAWTSKEFKNLTLAYENGVSVPRPIFSQENILVMEFIGDDLIPAPTLKELNDSTAEIYEAILSEVRHLYQRSDLVHSDLSEFNIFNYENKPVLFDFAQAVVTEHPLAEEFLIRDVTNITRFHKKLGIEVRDTEEILEWIKAE